MRVIMAVTFAVCATGCGKALMVTNPYPYNGYAPQNRSSEIGTVSFKSRGSSAGVDSGRFSAYKLMAQACRGRGYVIVRDAYHRNTRGGWKQQLRDLRNDLPRTPTYIDFQCIAH